MPAQPIPFVDLAPLVRKVSPGALARWQSCLENHEFVRGPAVNELEQVLASQLDAPHVVTCSSGTSALVLALRVMGVTAGMTVAIPNLTFWATFEAVAQVAAVPVLLDIDPHDLQLSCEQLALAHDRERFDAVVLVHLFGWSKAALSELRSFCQERDIVLVEDAAQAFGVRAEGESIFAHARASILSFFPGKVLGGAGDGGAMIFANEDDAAHARALANHGRSSHFAHPYVGTNARMGSVQAAYLLEMCKFSREILETRRGALAHYRQLLASVPGVRMHGPPDESSGNGYLCVVTTELPGELVAAELAKRHIGHARIYPHTLADQLPAQNALRFGTLEHSRSFCQHVVNLPLFYGIEAAEQRAVVSALAAILEEKQ